jgi:hypothetical protein
METKPGGDSGGDWPLPGKRAAGESMSCATGRETQAITAKCNRGVVARAAREFCSGVAGAAQQDFALGNGIAPQ